MTPCPTQKKLSFFTPMHGQEKGPFGMYVENVFNTKQCTFMSVSFTCLYRLSALHFLFSLHARLCANDQYSTGAYLACIADVPPTAPMKKKKFKMNKVRRQKEGKLMNDACTCTCSLARKPYFRRYHFEYQSTYIHVSYIQLRTTSW